jgi:ribonucleoside-diphosphate reductase alpha chain
MDQFEQGSIAAANAIINYLNRKHFDSAAAAVLQAWNDNTIVEPDLIVPADDPTTVGAPQFTREQAKGSGYTGDQCSNCNSMRMKVSGHCAVCEDCGTTTGCS